MLLHFIVDPGNVHRSSSFSLLTTFQLHVSEAHWRRFHFPHRFVGPNSPSHTHLHNLSKYLSLSPLSPPQLKTPRTCPMPSLPSARSVFLTKRSCNKSDRFSSSGWISTRWEALLILPRCFGQVVNHSFLSFWLIEHFSRDSPIYSHCTRPLEVI
jgi:hypothetical protein